MKYRKLIRAGLDVSEIGMGCEGFSADNYEITKALFDVAEENGINYFDLYSSNPKVREGVGRALKGRREKFIIQAHLCSVWENGQYLRSRDLGKVKRAFEELLVQLGTDYIDVGTIHYVDSLKDWQEIVDGDILEYMLKLKKEGDIRNIGMSSHNPEVAIEAVNSGFLDVLMFSINPFYDLMPPTEDVDELFDEKNYQTELKNMDPKREELYDLCERKGVGITVMKALGGGRILDEKRSHVKKALTVDQALSYCLDRPGVVSVLVGAHNVDELLESIAYESSTDDQRDYTNALSEISNVSWTGDCLYCSHCAPCPAGLDVASITKYLQLCQDSIPETVREHYRDLKHHAGECKSCHICESRCPFEVNIVENMVLAKEKFGF